MPYKWTKLYIFLSWLKNDPNYLFSFLNHEEALENALRSREIPIRGKERYKTEFARIETYLSNESRIQLWGNRIASGEGWGATVFDDVEVEAHPAENWLVQNAIDDGRALSNSTPPQPAARAIDDLKRYLSTRTDSPPPTKREFFARLKAGEIPELGKGYGSLSYRKFSAIWTECAPAAWTKGGFRPGRQRKT
jgi:hypothetical protein